MSKVLVVSPHGDDETLGCGGTLLKHKANGDETHWLIVTKMGLGGAWSETQRANRRDEIKQVSAHYGFTGTHELGFHTTDLDRIPMAVLAQEFGKVLRAVKPDTVYLPFRGDSHTDHRVTFDAATGCAKWFRYPSVKTILAYETPSETECGLTDRFSPNVYVDITATLQGKIDAMAVYVSENAPYPMPRSPEALTALARYRGSSVGLQAAEAFMLLREVR